MIMICTINIPAAAAIKFKLSSFSDRISGVDNNMNRNRIEINENRTDRLRDVEMIIGRISPIKTKLMTLKIEPSTRPLATGFCPIRIKIMPAITAVTMALDPNFFCMLRIGSIIQQDDTLFFRFDDIQNLTINNIGAARYPQKNKDDRKESFKAQPPIKRQTNKKTKTDTPGHGQPYLHDNGKVFCPHTVFFIIKNHAIPRQLKTCSAVGIKKSRILR